MIRRLCETVACHPMFMLVVLFVVFGPDPNNCSLG